MDILLIDDEAMIVDALKDFLTDQFGHRVTPCYDGIEAIEHMENKNFPMVLTDIFMPEMNGIEVLTKIKESKKNSDSDVVIITGHGDMKTAIEALRFGAYDYLIKPINIDELASVVSRVEEHQALLKENQEFSHKFDEKVKIATKETQDKYDRLRSAFEEIVGIGRIGVFSNKLREIIHVSELLHQDRSVPVLIEGETGVGKEVIARIIHYGKDGTSEPFISINCSAISPTLFEPELFGYVGGAFTGAKKEGMIGKFELAKGGTLFFDEMGDLPLDMQPKLLRVIQERSFYKVGGLRSIDVDVRLICATNKNLEKQVEAGHFRRDLFFRLNMGRIYIPPLRERKNEIVPLAQMFLEQASNEKKRRFQFISKEAAEILENHPWKGNARELKNVIERSVLLYDDIQLQASHLKLLVSAADSLEMEFDDQGFHPGFNSLPPDKLLLSEIENGIIRKALAKFNGNKSKTASYLGLTRSALRSRIKRAF